MNKEVSAVDWLVNELKQYNVGALLLKLYKKEIEQANKMFEQQIIDSYVNKELFINNPLKENEGVSRVFKEIKLAEQYYKETYGKI
jgi:hypothetical protein